jgi:hypothetical protein
VRSFVRRISVNSTLFSYADRNRCAALQSDLLIENEPPGLRLYGPGGSLAPQRLICLQEKSFILPTEFPSLRVS